jgi:hypothetical protein
MGNRNQGRNPRKQNAGKKREAQPGIFPRPFLRVAHREQKYPIQQARQKAHQQPDSKTAHTYHGSSKTLLK